MGIAIIVRRVGDDASLLSGLIEVDEWQALIDQDPDLRIRTEDHVAHHPRTGEAMMRMAARPYETELRVDDDYVPFLTLASGALTIGYGNGLDDPDNPVRQRSARSPRSLVPSSAMTQEMTYSTGERSRRSGKLSPVRSD